MSSFQDLLRSGIIDRIAKASPNRRKKLIEKVVKKEVSKKEKTKRSFFDYDDKGKWSKDLILEVLKQVAEEHGKLTCPLLRNLRKENPSNYPAPSTVKLRFDGVSWSEICKEVGGNAYPVYASNMGDSIDLNLYYFLDLYHRFGITSKALYLEARSKYPEIVPPYRKLMDLFGSFFNFKKIAKIDSCSEQIKRLSILIIDLDGRWPKRAQCKDRNIDIVFLDKKFGGRKELRSFMRDVNGMISMKKIKGSGNLEKQRRNKRQSK
jgi:hypothetical protein